VFVFACNALIPCYQNRVLIHTSSIIQHALVIYVDLTYLDFNWRTERHEGMDRTM